MMIGRGDGHVPLGLAGVMGMCHGHGDWQGDGHIPWGLAGVMGIEKIKIVNSNDFFCFCFYSIYLFYCF